MDLIFYKNKIKGHIEIFWFRSLGH